MNEKTQIEIERKFLIEYPDISELKKRAFRTIDIIQTYIVDESGNKMRLRSCFENGKYTYIKTVKKSVTDLRRIETEGELSEGEYNTLLNGSGEKKQLAKTRYCVNFRNKCFEIDIYPFWSNKAIMEIELADENESIVFPDFIKIINEVSQDKSYRNISLAKAITN